jgi:hypothetical protein
MHYYDKLLIAVPVVIALGAGMSIHPAVTISQGLAFGSLLATVVVFEMLFRNPPIEPTRADVGAVAVWGMGWLLAVVLA